MARVFKRESAGRDLVMHFVHLAEASGLETAENFLVCAEQSFEDLAQSPLMGSPVEFRRAELAGFREWRVKNYENFLIFVMQLASVELPRSRSAANDCLRMRWASARSTVGRPRFTP